MKFTNFILALIALCLFCVAVEAKKEGIPELSEEMLDKELKKRQMDQAEKEDPAVLAKEERTLRQKEVGNKELYGEVSEEHAKALSNLGRNVYKQGRLGESLEISMDVLSIYEELFADGPTYRFDEKRKRRKADYALYDHEKIYSALLNIANVAKKMGLKEEAFLTDMRGLNIMIKTYGTQSKEEIRHRSFMHRHGFIDEVNDVNLSGYTYTQFMKKWKALIQQRIRERGDHEDEYENEEVEDDYGEL